MLGPVPSKDAASAVLAAVVGEGVLLGARRPLSAAANSGFTCVRRLLGSLGRAGCRKGPEDKPKKR